MSKFSMVVLLACAAACGVEQDSERVADQVSTECQEIGGGDGYERYCNEGYPRLCDPTGDGVQRVQWVEFCCYVGDVGQWLGCWESSSICVPSTWPPR